MQSTNDEALLANYHAHNATSRSRELPVPLIASLLSTGDNNKHKREDLKVPHARVFTVQEFLTKEECEFFINTTTKMGYTEHSDVKAEYPPEYRNNERLIVISQELADTLWRRILPHLKAEDIAGLAPLGWGTEGTWLPVALNECFLFSRYGPGSYFLPHFDGMYINPFNECSIFTLTVYLNDEFEGGHLLFRAEPEKSDGEVVNDLKKLKDQPVIASYKPQRGTALVFNHDTLHEGEEVKKGTKYIFRTSMMFRKVEDLTPSSRPFESDPVWQKAKAIFASFNSLMAARDPTAFTYKFLEAQRLQLNHGRCLRAPPQSTPLLDVLPWELLDMVLLDLNPPRDLCNLMRVCKALKEVVRRGGLWKQLYIRRWGSDTLTLLENNFKREPAPSSGTGGEGEKKSKIDPDLMDWFGLFRKRFVMEKGLVPVIVYPAEYTHSSVHDSPSNPKYNCWAFPSRVGQEDCPWDASYATMRLETVWGTWYFNGNYYDWQMDQMLVFLCDKSLQAAGVSDNALCVVVYLSLPFTDHRDTLAPYRYRGDPDIGYVQLDEKANVDELFKYKVVKYMARVLHNVPALAFVDVELCALSSTHSTSGVVAFEYHILTLSSTRTIWRVLRYQDGNVIQESTHSRPISDKDPVRLVNTICKFQDAARASGTHMPTIIGRDADLHAREGLEFHEVNRLDREAFAEQLKQQLLKTGVEVIEVTPEDILKGARIAMGLPGFGDTVYQTALV